MYKIFCESPKMCPEITEENSKEEFLKLVSKVIKDYPGPCDQDTLSKHVLRLAGIRQQIALGFDAEDMDEEDWELARKILKEEYGEDVD